LRPLGPLAARMQVADGLRAFTPWVPQFAPGGRTILVRG
jgi:hypothetical protein